MSILQVKAFPQLDVVAVRGSFQRLRQQARMHSHRNGVNGTQPPYFIDGSSRLEDNCAGSRDKSSVPSAGLHFVFDTALEHHLQEILGVLVSRNDSGSNAVGLNGNACPPDLSTRQGGRSFDQWLGSPRATNFDAAQTRLQTRHLKPAPRRDWYFRGSSISHCRSSSKRPSVAAPIIIGRSEQLSSFRTLTCRERPYPFTSRQPRRSTQKGHGS